MPMLETPPAASLTSAAAQDESDPQLRLRLGSSCASADRAAAAHASWSSLWLQLFDGRAHPARHPGRGHAAAGRRAPARWSLHRLRRAAWTRPCSSTAPASASACRAPIREPSCIGCYEGDPEALRRQLRAPVHRPEGSRPAARAATGRPAAGRPGPAHRLPPRRRHLRLGLQGSLRADRCLALRHHRHLALQRAPLHADAQGLQDAARHRADRPGATSTAWSPTTATACSTTSWPTCRSIRSSWRWSSCSTCTRTRGRSASCRWWSARSTTASRPAARRRPRADIGRMIEALRRVEAETTRADLLHHQRRPGPHRAEVRRPRGRVREPVLTHSREQDQAILQQAEAADAGRLLPRHRRRGRPPPHLRPAADLHGARGASGRSRRQGAALRSVRPPARLRERQLRQRGVLPKSPCVNVQQVWGHVLNVSPTDAVTKQSPKRRT